MKNHQCPFCNSCKYYEEDNCQGCNYAERKKSNVMYGGYATETKKFSIGDKVRVTGVTDHRSVYNGRIFTIKSINPNKSNERRHYGVVEDDCFYIFYSDELELVESRDAVIPKSIGQDVCEKYLETYTVTYHPEAAISRTTIEKVIEDVKKNMNKKPAIGYYKKPIDKSKPGWTIKNVVFSDPATIVFWQDGSKTVVKAHNEVYDPEKGLAMAICKKVFGNQGNYFNVFSKWLPEDYETPSKTIDTRKEARPWRIWYRQYNEDGKVIGSGVYIKSYQRKNDATRVARKVYGDEKKYFFIVSMANPFSEVV